MITKEECRLKIHLKFDQFKARVGMRKTDTDNADAEEN
jgi:hypothetical protein